MNKKELTEYIESEINKYTEELKKLNECSLKEVNFPKKAGCLCAIQALEDVLDKLN